MTSEHDTKFPLLVEGKYRVWAMKMEAELVRKGLWGVVEVEVEPRNRGNDVAPTAVFDNCPNAFYALYLTIGD